eukprot:scaffold113980_cov24-Tisochrysis_lutea.AAC.5
MRRRPPTEPTRSSARGSTAPPTMRPRESMPRVSSSSTTDAAATSMAICSSTGAAAAASLIIGGPAGDSGPLGKTCGDGRTTTGGGPPASAAPGSGAPSRLTTEATIAARKSASECATSIATGETAIASLRRATPSAAPAGSSTRSSEALAARLGSSQCTAFARQPPVALPVGSAPPSIGIHCSSRM